MSESLLTALASFCNNPTCRRASLDEDANKEAKRLFMEWQEKNVWQNPWDGFMEIVKKSVPEATRVSRTEGSGIAKFNWYGDTWYICES